MQEIFDTGYQVAMGNGPLIPLLCKWRRQDAESECEWIVTMPSGEDTLICCIKGAKGHELIDDAIKEAYGGPRWKLFYDPRCDQRPKH
jgi:hypothetical protein